MKELNKENFETTINQDKLVLVDFFATWCGPCKMLKPILEKVAEEEKDVEFCSIDIDEQMEIAKKYRIFSVPSLLLFKKGEKIDMSVGLISYDDVLDFIDKNKN